MLPILTSERQLTSIFDKKTVENDCEHKEVCEDKLQQEMAFAVEKEENGGITEEQKTNSVIQMGKVIKKKTRTLVYSSS